MISKEEMPHYQHKADLFKGLAHPYRIRVLELLTARSPMTVADMLADTGLEASHLSQHLAVLRNTGLVRSTRKGNSVFYELTHPEVAEFLDTARSLVQAIRTDS